MTTTATGARRRGSKALTVVPETWAANGVALAPENPSITATWETITPEVAEQYLRFNTSNRKVVKAHVERLAKDMASGRYQITHQGVAISANGVLLDGQHRLMAITQSGVPVTVLVTRGLPTGAQTTMDGGKRRQVQDFLGGTFTAMRQSAGRLIVATRACTEVNAINLANQLRMTTTTETLDGVTSEDALAMEALAHEVSSASRNIVIMGPSPLLAATVLLIPDQAAAIEYLTGYARMTGLPDGDPRAALMKVRGYNAKRVHQAPGFGYAVRATNAYVQGQSVRVLRGIPATTVFLDLRQLPH